MRRGPLLGGLLSVGLIRQVVGSYQDYFVAE